MAYDQILDTDLLYIDRNGTLFKVPWKDIRSKSLRDTDEVLIQRGDLFYRVAVGDVWNGIISLQAADYFVAERGLELYSVEADLKTAVSFTLPDVETTDAVTLYLRLANIGSSLTITDPTGRSQTWSNREIVMGMYWNGTYTLSGDVSLWKFKGGGNTKIDFRVGNSAAAWEQIMATNDTWGEGIGEGLKVLGFPTGLKLKSLKRAFEGGEVDASLYPDLTAGYDALDVSAVKDASRVFANVTSTASLDGIDTWDMSNVETLESAFENAQSVGVPVAGWNVSNVVSFRKIFMGSAGVENVGTWNVSKGTTFDFAFAGVTNFDVALAGWNSSVVSTVESMFDGCSNYNSSAPTFSNPTSPVKIARAFNKASIFNQAINWTFASVSSVESTFAEAVLFDKPVDSFITNIVPDDSGNTNFVNVFFEAAAFNQKVSVVNLDLVNSANGVFHGAAAFNQDISIWDVGNIDNMNDMFHGATVFNQDLSGWCVSEIGTKPTGFDTASGFENENDIQPQWGTCPVLVENILTITSGTVKFQGTADRATKYIDSAGNELSLSAGTFSKNLSKAGDYTIPTEDLSRLTFNNSKSAVFSFGPSFSLGTVTNLQNCFRNCTSFNADLSMWDVSKAENFDNMFLNAQKFNRDLSSWDLSNATIVGNMFSNARGMKAPVNANWNLSKCTSLYSMFDNAYNFNADISGWKTPGITNMSRMFANAKEFDQGIQFWEVGNVTNFSNIFNRATAFNQPLAFWNTAGTTSKNSMTGMFDGASKFAQDIGTWCVTNVASKPTNFDRNAPAAWRNDPALQPQWGLCGPQPIPGIYPVIEGAAGALTAEIGDTLTKIEDGSVKINGEFIGHDSQQWQRNGVDTDYEWDNIAGATADTYTVVSRDFPGQVRLIQTFVDPDSGDETVLDSNPIEVEPAPVGAYIGFMAWGGGDIKLGIEATGAVTLNLPSGGTANYTGSSSTQQQTFTEEGFYYWESSTTTHFNFMDSSSNFRMDNRSDTSNITSFFSTFGDLGGAFNQSMEWLNTSSATNMVGIFDGSLSFNGSCNGWDLSATDSLAFVFAGTAFNRGLDWDTSLITNMKGMFQLSVYDQPFTLTTSNVTDFSLMFDRSQFNQSVSGLDTTKATNMARMFSNAPNFDSPSIAKWNVGNVTDMDSMFSGATTFNQNINKWCVQYVVEKPVDFDKDSGFENEVALQPDWGTCTLGPAGFTLVSGTLKVKLINPSGGSIVKPDGDTDIFTGTQAYTYTDPGDYEVDMKGCTHIEFKDSRDAVFSLSSTFYTGDVNDFSNMFQNCYLFNSSVSMLETSRGTSFSRMFYDARVFDHPSVAGFNLSNVTNLDSMFYNCYVFNQGLGAWDTSKIHTFTNLFVNCRVFDHPSVSGWNMTSAVSLKSMFHHAHEFNQDITGWDVSNVTSVEYLFSNAYVFNQPIGVWCMPKLSAGGSAFSNARIFNHPLDGWDFNNIGHAGGVFENAQEFNQDLSHWVFRSAVQYYSFFKNAKAFNSTPPTPYERAGSLSSMFENAIAFNQDISHWSVTDSSNMKNLFRNASSFDQDLSSWCATNITTEQDRLDWVTDCPLDGQTAKYPEFGKVCGFGNINLVSGELKVQIGLAADTYYIDTDGNEVPLKTGSQNLVLTEAGVYQMPMPLVANLNFQHSTAVFTLDPSSFQFLRENMQCSNFVQNCQNFDQDLSFLDLTKVNSFASAFANMSYNYPVDSWQLINASQLQSLFQNNPTFNQSMAAWPDLAKAENISYMLENAVAFNSAVFTSFGSAVDPAKGLYVRGVFQNCVEFEQDLSAWGPLSNKFTDVAYFFAKCTKFTGQGLDTWNPGAYFPNTTQSMQAMFQAAEAFNADISGWDMSNTKIVNGMFANTIAFDQDLSGWDLSNAEIVVNMFSNAKGFSHSLATGAGKSPVKAESYYGMFMNATAFNGDLSSWDTSNVTNMAYMLRENAFNGNISGWDVSNVRNMASLLWESSLFNQDLSLWCVSNVTREPSLFADGTLIEGDASKYPVWGTCPLGVDEPAQLVITTTIPAVNSNWTLVVPTVNNATTNLGIQAYRSTNSGIKYQYSDEKGTKPLTAGYFYAGPGLSNPRLGFPMNEWEYFYMASEDSSGDNTFYNTLADPANIGKWIVVSAPRDNGSANVAYQIIDGPSAVYGYVCRVNIGTAIYGINAADYNPFEASKGAYSMFWLGDEPNPTWVPIAGMTGTSGVIPAEADGKGFMVRTTFGDPAITTTFYDSPVVGVNTALTP